MKASVCCVTLPRQWPRIQADPKACCCLNPQRAFRTGTSTRLDDRVFAMYQLKYQPLAYSVLMIHPALYRVDDLTDEVRTAAWTSFRALLYFWMLKRKVLQIWSFSCFLNTFQITLNCNIYICIVVYLFLVVLPLCLTFHLSSPSSIGGAEHQRADHPSAPTASAVCGEAQQGGSVPHGCWNCAFV